MRRFRVSYYASTVFLGALAIGTLALLLSPPAHTERASKSQVMDLPDHWAITQTVFNREHEPLSYSIVIFVGGRRATEDGMSLKTGGAWVYTYHVHPEQLKDGPVRVTVYQSGQDKPLEDVVYHLDAARLKDSPGGGPQAPAASSNPG